MTADVAELEEVDGLATPTSVLVSDAAPQSDEWYAQRRRGITATDVPKILGVSRYGNAYSVWLDKLGRGIEDAAESKAAKWGRLLEDEVARDWARQRGARIQPIGTLAHVGRRWQLASLDRLTLRCPDGDPGGCPLEVKTRNAWDGENWRSDVPDDVLAQTHSQMVVTGFDHVHVAALIGGQDDREFRVDLDPALAALVLEESERVWAHVQAGTPPAVDADALLVKVLDAAHPDRKGEVYADRGKVRDLVLRYDTAHADMKAAEERKEQARAGLVALMGADGDRLVVEDGGVPVVKYAAHDRAGYTKVVPPTTYRQLWIGKPIRATEEGTDQS